MNTQIKIYHNLTPEIQKGKRLHEFVEKSGTHSSIYKVTMNPGTHQTPVTGKQRHGSLPILRSSLPLSKPPNPKSSPPVVSKKRSRVGQSQSFGDITLLNQQHSLELRWDPATPVNIPDQSRSNILRVSAPPLMYEMESRNRDCFLKRCYHCKKRLDQSKNIYMYG